MLKHFRVTVSSKGHFCVQHLTIQYIKVMSYTTKTENQRIITQENLDIGYIEITSTQFSRPRGCWKGAKPVLGTAESKSQAKKG